MHGMVGSADWIVVRGLGRQRKGRQRATLLLSALSLPANMKENPTHSHNALKDEESMGRRTQEDEINWTYGKDKGVLCATVVNTKDSDNARTCVDLGKKRHSTIWE